MKKESPQISKEAYEALKELALNGDDLYDCYKKPSARKVAIWNYYKNKYYGRCSVYSHNVNFFTIIALCSNGDIRIIYPTRTIYIPKGEIND